jgi:hypothetical protein
MWDEIKTVYKSLRNAVVNIFPVSIKIEMSRQFFVKSFNAAFN